jgi:hypothetical protein
MDYTTAEVIAWLQTRPINELYNYTDNTDCLFARFLKSLGHTEVSVVPHSWYSSRGSGNVPDEVNEASCASYRMGEALSYLERM